MEDLREYYAGIGTPRVVATESHTAYITPEGKLYMIRPGYGERVYTWSSQLIPVPEPVATVSPNSYLTAIISQSGKLYTFSDSYSDTGYNPPKPVLIPMYTETRCVAASYSHLLVGTTDGKLYSCGRGCGLNVLGRAVDNTVTSYNTLTEVALPETEEVIKVAASLRVSVALTRSGKVYTFGEGQHGELGTGESDQFHSKPTQVSLPEKIVEVGTGSWHTVFLGESGKLYGCGNTGYGQLGVQSEQSVYTPVLVPLPERILHVVIGSYSTLAQGESGKVYGLGVYDQYKSSSSHVDRSVIFPMSGIVSFAAGISHYVMITSEEQLYAVGCNVHSPPAITSEGIVPALTRVLIESPRECTPTTK